MSNNIDWSRLYLLPIFKAGAHASADRVAHEFSEFDLHDSAVAYDPDVRSAPLVIGHSSNDDVDFGEVHSLYRVDGVLWALWQKVDMAFAESVDRGRYNKVSTALIPPSRHDNPRPGVWYLRHVAFLGSQAPAVKGLPAVSFAEAGTKGLSARIDKFKCPPGYTVPKDQLRQYYETLVRQALGSAV